MNYYQIAFNNLEGFNPGAVHSVLTTLGGDWWHYLPSVYILETANTSYYLSNRIIEQLPGMNFIITKIDISDYNGYLDKRAWTWLEGKIVKNRALPPIKTTYVSHARSPLQDLLSGYTPKPTPNVDAARRAIDAILFPKIKK